MQLLYLITALLAAEAVSSVAAQRLLCHDNCDCPWLEYMNCTLGGLTHIPEGSWPNVTTLSLNGNSITALHNYSFTGFPDLQYIHLENNQLTSLNFEAFVPLPKLQMLFVNKNKIERILLPSKQLPIIILNLNNNKLSLLDPNILQNSVPKLIYLDIGNNPLKTSAESPLLNHKQLMDIRMEGIDASELGAATFKGMNLTFLRADNANIRDVTGVFVGQRLQELHLRNNRITQVTAGSFFAGRQSRGLYLSGNPLQRLDLGALSETMMGCNWCDLDFSETPLACGCLYEGVVWWAEGRGVALWANCSNMDGSCEQPTRSLQ